jgi:ABC-2 type transport system ATP-binding protein
MKIPISLVFNDVYAPCALVVMISCLENRKSDSFYSFYLLVPDYLPKHDRTKILENCKKYGNCDVNFLNIDSFDTYTSEELIYRIPNELPEHLGFCLHLGNDVIVDIDLQEIGELFKNDIKDNFRFAMTKNHDLGVVIINLLKKQVNEVYWLPLKYNAIVKELYSFSANFHKEFSKEEVAFREIFSNEEIEDAQTNPAIIHYYNQPLEKRDILFTQHWWKYAKKTAYYEKLKNAKYNNYIYRFEIYPTQNCNLNCKSCGTFSPLAKDSTFLNTEVLEKDLDRMNHLTNGYLRWIRICGGEPLLHPEITDILDLIRKYFSKSPRIELLTNAILLPEQSDIFWKKCKGNNIEINISHYPIKIDYDYIMEKGRQYGLNVHYDNYNSTPKKMFKLILDLEGSQDVAATFARCWEANSCSTLMDGKLYTCSLIPNVKHFNDHFKTNLEVKEGDYLDIHTETSYEQILDFLSSAPRFCKYCDFYKFSNGHGWGVSNKDIKEWTWDG